MSSSDPNPKRVWPFFVIAGVIAAIVLAVLWVSKEVKRVARNRDTTQEFRKGAASPQSSPASIATPSANWTNDMVWIPAGTFWMGNNAGQADEKPVHKVSLDGFWMDKTEVTNEQFEEFVRATKYVTVAERKPNPEDFPGADPELLVPGSVVFYPPNEPVALDNHMQWWRYVPGASWRHPEGPQSDLKGREKHPVVHICFEDALAYCKWAGKRLPTEAEWEYAARGGLEQKNYTWGEEQAPGGKWLANIWQGEFPVENNEKDGSRLTSAAASYPANGFGLYDMAGNVWEWCGDWYLPDYYENSPSHNPKGPNTSYDPNEPGVMKRVTRGGSYLCNDSYCIGYRPSARMKTTPDTGLSHTGFRCVKDAPAPSVAMK